MHPLLKIALQAIAALPAATQVPPSTTLTLMECSAVVNGNQCGNAATVNGHIALNHPRNDIAIAVPLCEHHLAAFNGALASNNGDPIQDWVMYPAAFDSDMKSFLSVLEREHGINIIEELAEIQRQSA